MKTHNTVKPYNKENTSKKEEVRLMFNAIAHRYDFLNHLLSLNIDKIWRKRLVTRYNQIFKNVQKSNLYHCDIATGTGDLAFELAKNNKGPVTGVDLSENMIAFATKKSRQRRLEIPVNFVVGDCENLKFKEHTFDSVSASFGVRNFENLHKGLKEMHRVLKPEGYIFILEFSQVQEGLFGLMYKLYFGSILPVIGRVFSKDNFAYNYLPESVGSFPGGDEFSKILAECGFKQVRNKPLTFGVATLYWGVKEN